MDINAMHVLFRQLGQKMGMQNVRSIFSEQIDLLLNDSIIDFVNTTVKESSDVVDNRVIDNSSNIIRANALRTLYKTTRFNLIREVNEASFNPSTIAFYMKESDTWQGRFCVNNIDQVGVTGSTSYNDFPNVLYYLGFKLGYCKCEKGWSYKETSKSKWVAPLFTGGVQIQQVNLRTIKDSVLAETLNDSLLKPTKLHPIVVIKSGNYNPNFKDGNLDVSIEVFTQAFDKVVDNDKNVSYDIGGYVPHYIEMAYIAPPAKVSLSAKVDCDLPQFLHNDIVTLAVQKYLTTIGEKAANT